MTDGELRDKAAHGLAFRSEVRAMAAELLAAREALRAADALAEASIDVCAVGVGVYLARCLACGSQATGPAGVEPDHAEDCALAAYRAARGAR